jgi:hypothetical protein
MLGLGFPIEIGDSFSQVTEDTVLDSLMLNADR